MEHKNIDKLVNEALAIEWEEAYKKGAIGYMARSLIQATMPHSKVDGHEFKRRNGAFKLVILADSEIGLPYGSIPRLLISWITTEAVKTKQKELILGRTLSEFMAELGLIPSGGRWGSITRLKDQMKRLFSASISCTYDDGKNWSIRNVVPVEKAALWWDPKDPNQVTKWESKLLLGDTFFNEITENPVPIDMRALKVLKQSPMAIDIYSWLTYRMSYLSKITSIPWGVLQIQFGANYKDLRQFKRRFLDQLKKVLLIYPEAKVKGEPESLILLPSHSHIQKRTRLFATTTSKSSIEVSALEQSKQQEKSTVEDTNLRKEYEEYRLNATVKIVENSYNKTGGNAILKEFVKYLFRKRLFDIRSNIINGNYSKAEKEELYNFVNNYWHHILDSLKSYSEFCRIDS